MNNWINVMGILVFLLVTSLACDNQKLPVESLDVLEERLRVAPEFQQLESIRDEVLSQLVQRKISKSIF